MAYLAVSEGTKIIYSRRLTAASAVFWMLCMPVAGFARTVPSTSTLDAYDILVELTAFGNRYAGAPNRPEAIRLLLGHMKRQELEVFQQRFSGTDPKNGREWPMVNLVGRFRPNPTSAVTAE